MSQKSTTAINHAMTTASAVSMIGRVPLFGGASFFAMILVWFEAFNRGVHMDYNWFIGTDKAVIYIAFIVGILFALLLSYVFAFEDYKKRKDNALVQFDLRYVISFLISGVIAGVVSYYIIFYGIDMFYRLPGEYIYDESGVAIAYLVYAQFETFLVAIICFGIGAIVAYVVDALVFHKVMDGTLTALNNQAKKKIQMQGELFIKDPAVQAQIKAKAQALGLTDETLIQKLGVVVSGADDPSFATTVQILKAQQK